MNSADDRPSIQCPRCGRRSWHPKDIAEQYCGFCHLFHTEMDDVDDDEEEEDVDA
jgi:ribosomal protein L37E